MIGFSRELVAIGGPGTLEYLIRQKGARECSEIDSLAVKKNAFIFLLIIEFILYIEAYFFYFSSA